MTLAIVSPFDIMRREGSHSTAERAYLEDASQTYKKGTPLVVTTAGYLGTAVVANPYTTRGAIVGVSVNPASNVAAGAVDPTTGDSYHLLFPVEDTSLEFVGQLDASSTTNAAGTHALAQTDLWTQYGITNDAASGYWYVNFSDTTTYAVAITRLLDPIGTIAGRVGFKFIPSMNWLVEL